MIQLGMCLPRIRSETFKLPMLFVPDYGRKPGLPELHQVQVLQQKLLVLLGRQESLHHERRGVDVGIDDIVVRESKEMQVHSQSGLSSFCVGAAGGFVTLLLRTNVLFYFEFITPYQKKMARARQAWELSGEKLDSARSGDACGAMCAVSADGSIGVAVGVFGGLPGLGLYLGAKAVTNTLGYLYFRKRRAWGDSNPRPST